MDAGEEVEVPRMQFKPCNDLLTLLSRQIDPLQPADVFTYSLLYNQTVQIVGNHLILNCNNCII